MSYLSHRVTYNAFYNNYHITIVYPRYCDIFVIFSATFTAIITPSDVLTDNYFIFLPYLFMKFLQNICVVFILIINFIIIIIIYVIFSVIIVFEIIICVIFYSNYLCSISCNYFFMSYKYFSAFSIKILLVILL